MNNTITVQLKSGTTKRLRYEDGYAVLEYIRKGETIPFRSFMRNGQ